jgi:uncharacterized protein (TIGR02246 family)
MGLGLVGSPPLAETPERTCLAFTEALSAGDLEAATSCLARDACFLTPDATAIRGRSSIRPVLSQLIARHPRIRVEQSSILTAGDVALAHQRWTILSAGVEGSPFTQISSATLLLRELDGHWKLALAAPWGVGSAEEPRVRKDIL